MRKICKYDPRHWLMQDNKKNLLLMNEKTGMIYDFADIQPERLSPEDIKIIEEPGVLLMDDVCDSPNTANK